MNHIEIRYTCFSNKADVTINGEKLGPYSELASAFNRSYLEMFFEILPGLDREIFDDYEIDFFGSFYQYELLLSAAENSEFCREIRFHEMDALYDQEYVQQRLAAICEENHITIEQPEDVTVYNLTNMVVSRIPDIQTVDIPNAEIGIFNMPDEIPATVHIPVIIGEMTAFHQSKGRRYYTVSSKSSKKFWEYIILEFKMRPLISEYVTALRYAGLTPAHKAELDFMKKNHAGYYLGEIPFALDKGKSCCVEFASFPPDAFVLRSDNDDIVSCRGTTLTAQEGGEAFISVINAGQKIVEQKQISVICHRYIEEIRLVPHFEYLKRSERNRIDVILTPFQAEDVNRLSWSVSRPDIIQIDENGVILALEPGKATITVSGVEASASLEVEVKPALQSMSFSSQTVRLKTGETIILECNISPSDASTEHFTWELDNKTIASINPSRTGRKCQITAAVNYEGKGNIRCYDSETKIGAVCSIEVISKVKPGILGSLTLWCWILGFLLPFLLPVSLIAGLYGWISDSETEHKMRYVVCTIGSFLTLLFWVMPAIMPAMM